MKNVKHVFENTGAIINNDQVLPKDSYEIAQSKYVFKILPRTPFWRFGIRLSKTKDVEFFHPEHRYKDPEFNNYIDIHLGAGEWNNAEWTMPSRLHLAHYNLPSRDHILMRTDNYLECSEVFWMIQKGEKPEDPFTSLLIYKNGEINFQSFQIDPAFIHFKIFAWADKIDFKLEMDLTISPADKQVQQMSQFRLPTIKLAEHERKYLEILYEALLENREIDSPLQIEQIWNEQQFPKDFKPETITNNLIHGNTITIWGIWNLDPQSSLFEATNKVILTIKKLLQSTQTRLTYVDSNMIMSYCKGLTLIEVSIIFKLLSQLPNFSRGSGSLRTGLVTLTLNDRSVYEHYKAFIDLHSFMNAYLKSRGVTGTSDELISSETRTSPAEGTAGLIPNFSKTEIKRISSNEIDPVMGVAQLAQDFAEIIATLPEEKGQMLGVFGRWGRGKSYFIDEVWKQLEKRSGSAFIRVDYQAWKYQETPASWAYLYEILVKHYEGEKKGFVNRLKNWKKRIYLNYKRTGLVPILLPVIAYGATILSWFLFIKNLKPVYTAALIPSSILICIKINKDLEEKYGFSTSALVKKYLTRFSFKEKLGVQAEIQEELIKLLAVWLPEKTRDNKKILLVVEDLDRCTEEKIIQNIDSLRIMLDDKEISKRLVILTAIDERILKNAVSSKYKEFVTDEIVEVINLNAKTKDLANELVSEYLDKLYISAIKLGSLNNMQVEDFFNQLIKKQFQNKEPTSTSNATVISTTLNAPALNTFSEKTEIKNDRNNTQQNNSNESEVVAESSPDAKIQSPQWQGLTQTEVNYLREAIKNWKGITPRKISIFYYRYLLCKNLVIQKYQNEKIKNIWQETDNMKLLLWLLKNFSHCCDPSSITIEKDKTISSTAASIKVKEFGENRWDKEILRVDYLYLIEIFEIVIAY